MNSIAASGDTVPRADVPGRSVPLKSRVVSAFLLGPLVLAALYVGYPAFDLLVILAVAVMAWEWRRLCARGHFDMAGYLFAATVVAAAGAAAIQHYAEAFVLVFAGALLVGVLAGVRSGAAPLWTAAGVMAVGVAGVALIWLRAGPQGFSLALWFLVAVWSTDIAAFFTGRAIGGPRLAPSISPNKTWAGLAGGVGGAAIWSVLWALWTDAGQPGTLALMGAGTAVLAQLGDLAVSVVKRRFGAKDASNLIPGHGGVLDRMDGIMGAAPFVALAVVLAKGDMSLWA